MGETTTGVRAVLSAPTVYKLWSNLVGAEQWRSSLAREHIRPQPGERVLDLGCGPAELLPHLGDVSYTGVDISERYIASARARHGDRGTFSVGDAVDIDPGLQGFDVVLAFGVLHHIDDDGVRLMLAGAARALKPDGLMVTSDGVFVAGQNPVARGIIARDRGQHVRTSEAYTALAAGSFDSVEAVVRHDMLRIPYSHCMLECRGPTKS
jgi:SAM-dependent methyltransferase